MKITKDQIRRARTDLGLSQDDFGAKLGMTASPISLLETGQTSPIDVDQDHPHYRTWRALLSGDRAALAQLPNPVAAWQRSSRQEQGLSLSLLAERAKISEHQLGAIERGQHTPARDALQRIETALGSPAPSHLAERSPEAVALNIGALEDFDPHMVEARPVCAGIYVFYDISERPIYVGESKNIRQRIRQHEEKFWFKRPLVEYAAYVRIDDDTMRIAIERILINFLRSNAVLNRQHVSRAP